ncbi:uncharacterized protein CBL_14646 [Carabus blaptoides fortunei]
MFSLVTKLTYFTNSCISNVKTIVVYFKTVGNANMATVTITASQSKTEKKVKNKEKDLETATASENLDTVIHNVKKLDNTCSFTKCDFVQATAFQRYMDVVKLHETTKMPGVDRRDDQYSSWVGLIYVYNLIVGTGALTLPAVFAKAGWALSIAVITMLAFMGFVTVTFIVEVMACANAVIQMKRIQSHKIDGESEVIDTSDSEAEGHPPVASVRNVPHLIGVCVYSFMCHHSLPGLVAPFADKTYVVRQLGLDYAMICLFYVVMACQMNKSVG